MSLAALLKLSHAVFDRDSAEDYESWKGCLRKSSINAEYWFTVIEVEVLPFMFIKSLRYADFPLSVGCLKEMITWMFALDHIHYARWMTVFLEDLFLLPCSQRTTFECLSKGYLTVKKCNRVFSNMGIDQDHEQSNKLVKIDGGAIGNDNENALVKWAIAGPIIT